MRLPFTKMHGAGNDFVVIDATRAPVQLTVDQWRHLADRHRGVGADQMLVVEPPDGPDVDFVYRIFNADGEEVEQCGNGARCFARFVHDRGLTTASTIRVRTKAGVITPTIQADGLVTVDMGLPKSSPEAVGFDVDGLAHRREGQADQWQMLPPNDSACWIAVVSMGNPHAVQWVDHVETYPVAMIGAWLEAHPRFAYRVNAGFAQQTAPDEMSLRVYERGAGETLACGTGACAAVVTGILIGRLPANTPVRVQTRGGLLKIQWSGQPDGHVMMTGPAETVFEGVIEL